MERIRRIKLCISIGLLFLLCISSGLSLFPGFGSVIDDYFLRSGAEASPDVVMIAIDEESIGDIGRYPWDRSIHARLIETVAQGEPAVIGLDLTFSEASNAAGDQALAEAIELAGVVVPPVVAGFGEDNRAGLTPEGMLEAQYIQKPIGMIAEQGAGLGHINTLQDAWDAKVRRHIPYIQDASSGEIYDSFAIALYRRYAERMHGQPPVIKIPEAFNMRPYIHFVGPPESVEWISYTDALDPDSIDPEYFRDKIVLVGLYATGTAEDAYITPASGVQRMYGIEVHANIIHNLIYNQLVYPSPVWLNVLLCLAMGGAAIAVSERFRRLLVKAAVTAAMGIAYFWVYILFLQQGWIIQIFYPLFGLILLFLIDLVASYIAEYSKRREITTVFGRYMAPQVIDLIIREGEAGLKLAGSKKEITVLFADIRGFTTMSEKLPPEQVVSILNAYLSLVTERVFANQGVLDKYIGDAAMALYNVPYDMERHAYLAVITALEMKQAAHVMEERLKKEYGQEVQFGIGINSGYAVVGNIGSGRRLDYTAIGDTVNIAARLESNARPGQILISKAVYEQVKEDIEAAYVGPLSVKGRTGSVETYEVISAVPK